MRAELRKSKILKKDPRDRVYMKVALAIPTHLLKVSIFVILFSFLAMVYVILFEKEDTLRCFSGNKDCFEVDESPMH